jgi:hypothetical protein
LRQSVPSTRCARSGHAGSAQATADRLSSSPWGRNVTTNDDLFERLRRANARVQQRYPGENLRRQPVHTVYGGAHLFRADTASRLGTNAIRALEEYAPRPESFVDALGIHPDDAATITPSRRRARSRAAPSPGPCRRSSGSASSRSPTSCASARFAPRSSFCRSCSSERPAICREISS